MSQRFLVVDVGGTKILAAVAEADGRILSRFKLKTDRKSKENLLAQLDLALGSALAESNTTRDQIAGLALGVPGVIDSARGYVVYTPNTPLSETPLAEILRQKWNVPVIVGNDVNVGMAGEVWRGAARGATSAFGIFVGTGIGGGLFLNGQLIEGFRGLGGEIGHLMIPLGADELANMPSRKHTFLEELCSRTAIENQLRHAITKEGHKSVLTDIVGDKKLERIRSGALKEALKKGDPLVTDVMRRASYLLGLATASVVHVVDPQVVVFGGGVIEACGKWMMPWIEKTVQKVAMEGTGAPLQLVESTLGDDAILYGGLSLLLRHAQTADKPTEAANGTSTQALASAPMPIIYPSVDKPSRG